MFRARSSCPNVCSTCVPRCAHRPRPPPPLTLQRSPPKRWVTLHALPSLCALKHWAWVWAHRAPLLVVHQSWLRMPPNLLFVPRRAHCAQTTLETKVAELTKKLETVCREWDARPLGGGGGVKANGFSQLASFAMLGPPPSSTHPPSLSTRSVGWIVLSCLSRVQTKATAAADQAAAKAEKVGTARD